MSADRPLLEELFSRIAFDGELGDDLDLILGRVGVWIGETNGLCQSQCRKRRVTAHETNMITLEVFA